MAREALISINTGEERKFAYFETSCEEFKDLQVDEHGLELRGEDYIAEREILVDVVLGA